MNNENLKKMKSELAEQREYNFEEIEEFLNSRLNKVIVKEYDWIYKEWNVQSELERTYLSLEISPDLRDFNIVIYKKSLH